jgi:glycosyltransferase involved in cell wall biosynthesis
MTRLSVVVPAFNEAGTIRDVLDRLRAVPVVTQIVVVDDGSTDGTAGLLAGEARIEIVRHDRNRGKGASIRTGLSRVTGDVVVVQDADLEYDPRDFGRMMESLARSGADAVYGSRYLGRPEAERWHTLANRALTLLSNWMTGLHLTDMETCYKMVRTGIARRLRLCCDGFGIEPELTARLAHRGARIVEVPVSYRRRGYSEGKKIGLPDAFRTVLAIFRYGLLE